MNLKNKIKDWLFKGIYKSFDLSDTIDYRQLTKEEQQSYLAVGSDAHHNYVLQAEIKRLIFVATEQLVEKTASTDFTRGAIWGMKVLSKKLEKIDDAVKASNKAKSQ